MRVERARSEVATYRLEQSFRYSYASPAHELRQRLLVVPRGVHAGQRRVEWSMATTGAETERMVRRDGFGNDLVEVHAESVAREIEFLSVALIDVHEHEGVTTVGYRALGDARLLMPSPLTRPNAALSEAARELSGAAKGLDLAEQICTWVHRALAYEFGITGVRTTASEAYAIGRGVCQDYSHVMLSVCRAAGMPARYVSGHLVGDAGSHAWVEVILADTRMGAVAVAFDPTNERRVGADYVTVVLGREYTDVAPTSGTFEGSSPGILTAHKTLGPVGLALRSN